MVVYRLYDMKMRELIVAHEKEKIIYKAIVNWHKKDPDCRLSVIKKVNKGDVTICAIRNEEDFVNYLKDYEYRLLTGKSCVELKREILDLAEKPKVKTLKKRV